MSFPSNPIKRNGSSFFNPFFSRFLKNKKVKLSEDDSIDNKSPKIFFDCGFGEKCELEEKSEEPLLVEKKEVLDVKEEVKENRQLYEILHKIKNNMACQKFEHFVKTYYLSKKHSYLTVLRQNVEELYNFDSEYIIPLNHSMVKNLYDSSTLNMQFRKVPAFQKNDEYEVTIDNEKWKTILIHGVEKMILAQNFSANYLKKDYKSDFHVSIKQCFEAHLLKIRPNVKQGPTSENISRVICSFEKLENSLEIIVDISLKNLIPLEDDISKVNKKSDLKFEDIDTILVTHKRMDFQVPTTLKINISGHNCLNEIKSLRNFLMKLDRDSTYKANAKPYSINELICDENFLKISNENKYSRKINKITRFHLYQYDKFYNMEKMNAFYYLEIEIQNNKGDFRFLTSLLKALHYLKNIFLVNFNINILEENFADFYIFLDKNRSLWLQNKYLTAIKINQNYECLSQTPKTDFKNMLNKRKVAFLQALTLSNLKKKKEMKFRIEICRDILNYLI